MLLGVGEQVAEHPLEAHPVDASRRRCVGIDVDGDGSKPGMPGDAPAQLGDVEGLEVEVGGAGVDAGQFEEIEHHPVEAADLADDHVDSLTCPCRHLVAARLRAPRSPRRGR